ncbi:hypothetical protein [Photorhabdus sp. CRCIA-P01]|uniref:hypothetical protein n=1 Tax=Photorhabdus sp. CRCIA-P01 TaxID=2019570 RepID=UPI00130071D6
MNLIVRLLSQIIQSVKVTEPLAKSNGQGVAVLRSRALVNNLFASVPAIVPQWRFRQGRLCLAGSERRSANPV